ncbi:MAG: DUF2961 domain-containing protein [Xanthomonadales bacterium]|nr:DUF2961 domain-containing protein [Xanthomonadales bacterium]
MSILSRWIGLVALWPSTLLAYVPPWQDAQAMAQLDASIVSVERSSFCSGQCRYDRYGWGSESSAANPYPQRGLYPFGGTDAVLYDDPGAGVVTRLWLTVPPAQVACLDASLQVHFQFGPPIASFDLPLAALFDGSTPPFTAPLTAAADSASGGYVSYVPINYSHGLRIAVSGLDVAGACSGGVAPRLWYQIDAQHLAPDSQTNDFSLNDNFVQLRQFLSATGDDPWQRGLPASALSVMLAPAGSVTLAEDTGSGWLAGLRLHLAPSAFSAIELEIHIDGDSAVSMPLSRLFAADPSDPLPPRSPMLGVDAAGWLYLWWPMPYRQQLQVALIANGLSHNEAIQAQVILDPSAVDAAAGQFRAERQQQCGSGQQHQLTLLESHGQGKLMGLTGRYAAQSGPNPNYLEGDTRLRMDGGIAPAWQGSGLEDFYNGGFYFAHGAYRQPWSGASTVDAQGESAMWRLLLGDAPHYADGLAVWQEAGAAPDQPVDLCADTVTYRYVGQRALVPVQRLQAGAADAQTRYAYQHPAATCANLTAQFADAAATTRSAVVCRYSAGSSHFEMHLQQPAQVLRLHRMVDASVPGQAARIVVNGVSAGYFGPVRADSQRRWQSQDAPLLETSALDLDIDIEPLWGSHGDSGSFTESTYELWATPGDKLFADGFEL